MNKRSLSGHLLVTNSSFYGILRRHKFFLQQLGAAKNMDLQNAFALTQSRRNCRNCKIAHWAADQGALLGSKCRAAASSPCLFYATNVIFFFYLMSYFHILNLSCFFCKKNIILLVFFMSYFHILYSVSTGTKIGRVKCNYSCNKMLNILKYEWYVESEVSE